MLHHKFFLVLKICTLFIYSASAMAFCWTSGVPESDPSVLLKNIWVPHIDGSALYLHRFQIQDFDEDGKVDILLLRRDASYSGHFFEIFYYPGQVDGFCGIEVAGDLHAINPYVKLHIDPIPGEYPKFVFSFDTMKGNVGKGSGKRPVEYQTWEFSFDKKKGTYAKKLIKAQRR